MVETENLQSGPTLDYTKESIKLEKHESAKGVIYYTWEIKINPMNLLALSDADLARLKYIKEELNKEYITEGKE